MDFSTSILTSGSGTVWVVPCNLCNNLLVFLIILCNNNFGGELH
jgi:hypothetical protein